MDCFQKAAEHSPASFLFLPLIDYIIGGSFLSLYSTLFLLVLTHTHTVLLSTLETYSSSLSLSLSPSLPLFRISFVHHLTTSATHRQPVHHDHGLVRFFSSFLLSSLFILYFSLFSIISYSTYYSTISISLTSRIVVAIIAS